MSSAPYPPTSPLTTGLACRCPRCGRGPLYKGYLPEWLTWTILVIVVLGGALLLLRPAKAIMVALQYKNRAGEFGTER